MTFKNKTIGILGGGQLGKMTAIAAKKLGYHSFLYCPKGDNPAEYSVNEYIYGNWDDNKKLELFGSNFFNTFQTSFMPINEPNPDTGYILDIGVMLLVITTAHFNIRQS